MRKKAGHVSLSAAHADTLRLLQELQIHQIELELQNEELQQAKAEVDASLEKFADLYDFSPSGYFTLAADGTIQLVNLTGATLLGFERARLLGRSFGHLVAADHRPAFKVFLKEVFANSARRSGEFDLLGQGSSPLTVSIDAQRLPSGMECRAVVVDITARKCAENKMRISEVRYRRLFEAAKDGVLLLDPATCKITDANPFMTALLGYSHEQLVGKQLFEIGLLKDETASRTMFEKLKKSHQVRYENLPLESQSGRHQEVEVVANLYQENGQAVIQCNIRDITVRKKAEDALRGNEALFTALVEQTPMGVYVVDARFRLQRINPRAFPHFSKIHPLLGQDFAEILHVLWPKRVAEQIVARFRHTLKTGKSYQSPKFSHRRRDIGVNEVYEWQIQRVTLPIGEYGVVCFFNNITERILAERAQRDMEVLAASNEKLKREIVRRLASETALKKSERQALQALEEARELQEKLRQIAHQLLMVEENQRKQISRELHDKICQLLVGINVHLALFAKTAKSDPKGISRALVPLRRLVGNGVEIVHRFARDLRPSALDDLGLIPALRSYVGDFPKRKGRQIQFTAVLAVETLNNDKQTVLYRVAQEALVNAAKHATATVIKVSLFEAADGVCLEVTDNGKGFDVKRHVSSARSKRLGMLGMRERVEMVGGRLVIESVPGRGTTVRAVVG
ncbi:MAG: PAS domain S-box protein [Opitutaceae bacterium]|nr:PAS domain S-box protein [Opitutaceae bacterium]